MVGHKLGQIEAGFVRLPVDAYAVMGGLLLEPSAQRTILVFQFRKPLQQGVFANGLSRCHLFFWPVTCAAASYLHGLHVNIEQWKEKPVGGRLFH